MSLFFGGRNNYAFFISSALNVSISASNPDLNKIYKNNISVFDNEIRFKQTLDTIQSIKKYCSNSLIILYDCSFLELMKTYINQIEDLDVVVLYVGNHNTIQNSFPLWNFHLGKSLSETLGFISALDWYKNNNLISKRIYKITGRYSLNENFILDREDFKDSFVFTGCVDSWMSPEQKNLTGAHRVFQTRFWHMDFSLFESLRSLLPKIFDDCIKYQIDIEHSYYKHLHNFKYIELNPIGLQGAIAPSGEIIKE